MKKVTGILLVAMMATGLLAGCGMSGTYNEAMSLYEEGNYEEAMNSFEELGDYKDSEEMLLACKYAQAKTLYRKGNYEEATNFFEELGDYEDSEKMLQACKDAQIIHLNLVNWDTMQGLLIMECNPTGDTGKYGGYEFKLITEPAQEGTFDVETVTIEIAMNGMWSLRGEYENVTQKSADEILVELALPEDGCTITYFYLLYLGFSSMQLNESVESVFMLRPDSGTFTPD